MVDFIVKKEFPIQVTAWSGARKDHVPWEKFLNDKGIETHLASVTKQFPTYTRKMHALYRALTPEEESGIKHGKYLITIEDFLVHSISYWEHHKSLDNCVCPRCGIEHRGYAKEGRNLCSDCKESMAGDITEGESFGWRTFKRR